MEKVAKWVAVIALFIIPFLPLYVESSLYFPFISGKGFAFRILVEIAFGAWMVLFLIDRKYRPKFSWPGALFGLLVIWMFIADLFAVNPYKAFWSNFERMDGWVTLIHVLMFFVVIGAVFTEKLWKNWWRAFLVGVSFICIGGVLQLMGLLTINQGGVRLDSTFGNSIYLADYLLFAIPITLWQALGSKQLWLRSMWLLLAASEVIILFYTETRGAFIGVFVASVVAATWWVVVSAKTSKKHIQKGAVVALGLLLLFGGSFFLARNSAPVQNNTTLHRLASIFSANEFKVRFVIWDMAQKGTIERPFFGWGQEGFNYVFNEYYNTYLYKQEAWFDRAHNTYLDWLTAGGVPALLLFLVFLVSSLWYIARSSLPKEQKILLFSAVFAYGISALSVFDNLFTYIPLLAIAAYVHGKIGRPIAALEKMKLITTPALQAAAALVIALLTITTIWVVNIPAVAAGQTLIQAMQPQASGAEYNLALFKKALAHKTFASQEIREQLITYTTNIIRDASISNETKVAFVRFTLSEMNTSLTEAPQDARLHSMMASLYAMIGDSKSALKEADIALTLSPKKQTLYIQKGTILWQFKDVAGAKEAFHTAYALDPSIKDIAAYDAAGLMAAGDMNGGFALLQKVFGTTAVNNDALIRVYYATGHFDELIAVERLRATLSGGLLEDRLAVAVAIAASGKKDEAFAELDTIEREHPEAKAQIEKLRAGIASSTPKAS